MFIRKGQVAVKIAIVHDYLNQRGGAEKVVEALHEAFPEAPIYTSFYIPENTYDSFRTMDIRTSFMQKLPGIRQLYRIYFYFYPLAFYSFNFTGYDVIISSSSAFAKGINKRGAYHICYCHSPMRAAWNYADYMGKGLWPSLLKLVLYPWIVWARSWDIKTAKNVDHFIANSENIAAKISRLYGCSPAVINPPIDTSTYFVSDEIGDYFLAVSRPQPYKRIDLAIEAMKRLKYPLKVIGTKNKSQQGNIEFLGVVDNKTLAQYYSHCRALIFPGEEDFGMVPLEAMAAGRPVIAYGKGGALETVVDGQTGILFYEQTVDALIEAIRKYERSKFNNRAIRQHAQSFDKNKFKEKITEFVEMTLVQRSKK